MPADLQDGAVLLRVTRKWVRKHRQEVVACLIGRAVGGPLRCANHLTPTRTNPLSPFLRVAV